MEPNTFGKWLRLQRKALDLTREAFAERVGYSAATIRKLEAEERRPSAQIVDRLANLFNIPPGERPAFQRFARGDWQAGPRDSLTERPWHGANQSVPSLTPLTTIAVGATAGPLHNLPAPTTAFVGREQELAALAGYFSDPHIRLVTILGLGGMGKTRLALAAAEQAATKMPAQQFAHGVVFVALARLEAPEQLVPAISEALQLQFQRGREPKAQLLDHLRGKALLLVLDNFEHLRASASLVDEILRAAAKVKVLITSREKLNLQAEQLVPIGGMALPAKAGPEANRPLAGYSAIQLFCERGQHVRPDFGLTKANQEAVVEICRLVHGMPLGIVLAAAWLETFSPQDIAAEMRTNLDFLETTLADMPERQRSLRGAFDHTWRLMPEQERTVFQSLSTFRGGFTRQAAEAVAGAARRDLQALVDKSLLSVSAEGRYDLHELLRQFAAEKLAAAPEQEVAVRDRHSAYYCNFLSGHTDNWHNAQQLETLDVVTLEADNAHRAWQWAVEQADWLRLEPAMDSWAWFYNWRGRFGEAHATFQAIVTRAATADAAGSTARPQQYLVWAKALTWQGKFAPSNHDAHQALQQSLSVLERAELAQVDTRRAKALALSNYVLKSPDRAKSREFFEQSLALYRDCGDPWGMAIGLNNLAWLDWRTGHYAQAEAHAQASLALHQARGDGPEQIHTLTTLAWIYTYWGRLEKALQLRWEALALCQQSGFRSALLNATTCLAYTLFWHGSFEEASQWADKSLALCLEMGPKSWEGFVRVAIQSALIFKGQYGTARQEAVHTTAIAGQDSFTGVEASEHWSLGYLALAECDYASAWAAFAESRRLYEALSDNSLGTMLAGPGYAACGEGRYALAGPHFVEALKFALALQDYITLILALPGVAWWLALTGQIARAMEVWELALTLPFVANSKWHADVVGQRLEAAAAALAPAEREAARLRGRALHLWDTAAALVGELQQTELKPATTHVDEQ